MGAASHGPFGLQNHTGLTAKETLVMLMDIGKLPVPPSDSEPGLMGWLTYLESIRPFVEAEFLAQMTRAEKATAPDGSGARVPGAGDGGDLPAVQGGAVKELAWMKEQAASRSRFSTSKA